MPSMKVFTAGVSWQTELLLCFAVVDLLAGIILLFGHLWDGKLWKAFLQGQVDRLTTQVCH